MLGTVHGRVHALVCKGSLQARKTRNSIKYNTTWKRIEKPWNTEVTPEMEGVVGSLEGQARSSLWQKPALSWIVKGMGSQKKITLS